MTGRMMDETLGKVHLWLTFIGFHATFLVRHWLGAEGVPRRYIDYLPTDGFTTLNTISSIGPFPSSASSSQWRWPPHHEQLRRSHHSQGYRGFLGPWKRR